MLITTQARAYVNHGRWVADCPRRGCTNARLLKERDATFHCNVCKLVASIEWPADADAIWEALERRPVPRTRNWYPAGHELALRFGLPHGQSVQDLYDENHENGVD